MVVGVRGRGNWGEENKTRDEGFCITGWGGLLAGRFNGVRKGVQQWGRALD